MNALHRYLYKLFLCHIPTQPVIPAIPRRPRVALERIEGPIFLLTNARMWEIAHAALKGGE